MWNDASPSCPLTALGSFLILSFLTMIARGTKTIAHALSCVTSNSSNPTPCVSWMPSSCCRSCRSVKCSWSDQTYFGGDSSLCSPVPFLTFLRFESSPVPDFPSGSPGLPAQPVKKPKLCRCTCVVSDPASGGSAEGEANPPPSENRWKAEEGSGRCEARDATRRAALSTRCAAGSGRRAVHCPAATAVEQRGRPDRAVARPARDAATSAT